MLEGLQGSASTGDRQVGGGGLETQQGAEQQDRCLGCTEMLGMEGCPECSQLGVQEGQDGGHMLRCRMDTGGMMGCRRWAEGAEGMKACRMGAQSAGAIKGCRMDARGAGRMKGCRMEGV